MGVIAGLCNLDAPLDAAACTTVPRSVGACTPGAVWMDGQVVLAHDGRSVPVLHADASGRCVVADARLDNRTELRRLLGLPGATDAELILAAHGRWGTGCADRLVGDFAFAVWDGSARTLFAARDPMGVRPFYYHASGQRFAFASDVRTLLELPGVPAGIDEQRVAEFVLNADSGRERTFYAGIARLPAAHTLRVARGVRTLRRYWAPDLGREIRFGRDADYADAFRELLAEAVRTRLPEDGPIGASLSGGLDSSSIVCVARSIAPAVPLHAFSLVFPDLPPEDLRRIDERPWMAAVIEQRGGIPHVVRGDRVSPLGDARRIVTLLQAPFAAPNLYLHWAMYGAAAQHGVTSFLDGFDGDSAVGHGLARLDALLARGERATYDDEVRSFARHRGIDASRVVHAYGLPRLGRLAREGRWWQWLREARHHHRQYGISRRELALTYGVRAARGVREPEPPAARLLRPAFRAPLPTAEAAARSAREAHVHGLMQSAYQDTLEVAHQCARSFGVAPAYPYFDRRLIEFCIALPEEQSFRDGWTRRVLRDAMGGILPEPVRWRADKGSLAPAFHRGLRQDDAVTLNALPLRTLDRYLDLSMLERMRNEYLGGRGMVRGAVDPLLLFRTATLALWLEERERGAVGTTAGAGAEAPIAALAGTN